MSEEYFIRSKLSLIFLTTSSGDFSEMLAIKAVVGDRLFFSVAHADTTKPHIPIIPNTFSTFIILSFCIIQDLESHHYTFSFVYKFLFLRARFLCHSAAGQ